jgi:hypothetical protein
VLLKYEYVPYPIAKANKPITNMLANIFLFISISLSLAFLMFYIPIEGSSRDRPAPAQQTFNVSPGTGTSQAA